MDLPTLERLEQAARVVHAVMAPTPQICWPQLCERLGTEVWVKHENHTQLGAFKIRGGIVYFEELRRREPDLRGVVVVESRGRAGYPHNGVPPGDRAPAARIARQCSPVERRRAQAL